MNQEIIDISGRFYKNKYFPNDAGNRDSYIRAVNRLAIQEDYSFFYELDFPFVKHLDRQFTTNFYFRDWQRVMSILKDYYGNGNFHIVNGFRSPFELGVTVHSTGLALDILVNDQEHADRVMGAAYMTGIPTIIPVGEINHGQGHVHLDLAPNAKFSYNAGNYYGPWGDVR